MRGMRETDVVGDSRTMYNTDLLLLDGEGIRGRGKRDWEETEVGGHCLKQYM